jgi:hypothetical protein
MRNRRAFLHDMGWGAMAAAVAGISAYLFSRRDRSSGVSDRSKHVCSNQWICGGCSRVSDCILPQALSARSRGMRQGGG